MTSPFRDMAQRSINAEENFIESIMALASCTMPEAEKVLRVFRKLKIVKLDIVGGRYDVKHGAFLDLPALQNAIAFDESPKVKKGKKHA